LTSKERAEKARFNCCRLHIQRFKEGTHNPECEVFQYYFKMALENFPEILACGLDYYDENFNVIPHP